MLETVGIIPSPREIRELVPFSVELAEKRNKALRQICDILSGCDKRKLFIIGPCSADNERSVCEYACRLSNLAKKVQDRMFVIVRVFTNKPRTRGEGYKGILHTPDPKRAITDITNGLIAARKMHIKVIEESGLFTADEMLYPNGVEYINDVVAYMTVGARSSENQMHRLVASGMDIPVGIKNPMNGSMSMLASSTYAAQISNEFMFNNRQVKSNGNQYAHAILRGYVDVNDNNIANYCYKDILKLNEEFNLQKLNNRSVIVDTNHSNSGKDPFQQGRIVNEVLSDCNRSKIINDFVKGFLIESYIEDGNQPLNGGVYGKSITDSCLGWSKTEELLLRAAELVKL